MYKEIFKQLFSNSHSWQKSSLVRFLPILDTLSFEIGSRLQKCFENNIPHSH